jgi:hypothetical protein
MDGDVNRLCLPHHWAAALQSGYLLADIFGAPMKEAPAFTGAFADG